MRKALLFLVPFLEDGTHIAPLRDTLRISRTYSIFLTRDSFSIHSLFHFQLEHLHLACPASETPLGKAVQTTREHEERRVHYDVNLTLT